MTGPQTAGADGPETMPYGTPGTMHSPGMPPGGNYPVEPNVVYHYADASAPVPGEPEPEPAPTIPPERPKPSANKAEWETFAVACGATAEQAHAMTKADLVDAYGDPRSS